LDNFRGSGRIRRLELRLRSEDLQSLKQLRISLHALQLQAMDASRRESG
jgi:predicted secreted protein